MQGNVREWVSNLYAANFYSASPAADPTGPSELFLGHHAVVAVKHAMLTMA
jgi:hypothetical protein